MKRLLIILLCAISFSSVNAQIIPVSNEYSWCAQYDVENTDIHLFVYLCFHSTDECTVGVMAYNQTFVNQINNASYFIKNNVLTIDFADEYPSIEHIFHRHNEIQIISVSDERLELNIGATMTFGKGFNGRTIQTIH